MPWLQISNGVGPKDKGTTSVWTYRGDETGRLVGTDGVAPAAGHIENGNSHYAANTSRCPLGREPVLRQTPWKPEKRGPTRVGSR